MSPTVASPPFGLTAEERARYESLVPEIPEEVVRELVREWGCREQREDLFQEAHLGVARGVRTFDPAKGALRPWVFFSALHAAQAVLRRERRHSGRVGARMWDGLVDHAKQEEREIPVMASSDDEDRAALREVFGRAAAAAFVAVASTPLRMGAGEDAVIDRMTGARCAEALEQAVGDLSPRRRELLQMCFADDRTVKEAAAARGEKGYRAELLEFHRVVDIVAARLRGKGFHELPPFPAEAGGTILKETDSPSKKG
jgi:RNA polymerase sigma factor (sigma-70 family)